MPKPILDSEGKRMLHEEYFYEEEGIYLYSCGCKNCRHEMLWPKSMFSKNKGRKFGIASQTAKCNYDYKASIINDNFRYSVYRYQYRRMLKEDGLPKTKLKNTIENNLNDPIYLEFKKLFEKLDKDEKGYYLCPIYNIPLYYDWSNGRQVGRTPNSPSVDRIDNTKKHTMDNIQIISVKANLHKRDATLEELIAQGEHAKKLLKERQSFK